ncbi:MAG: hypothetical protein H6R42_886 [Nitrospirae bacterium]|jgi:hypothetical protein|nr:hypothetical protein [Nitrospirota bacterium]
MRNLPYEREDQYYDKSNDEVADCGASGKGGGY